LLRRKHKSKDDWERHPGGGCSKVKTEVLKERDFKKIMTDGDIMVFSLEFGDARFV